MPRLAQRLLLLFLRSDLAEEVLGDLEEKFRSTARNKSLFRAKLNYWFQVMNYLRPFAIRSIKRIYVNDYYMFQNYFRVGWRNMTRNLGYTSINVGGLAVGMAVAILNGLWIWDELSFNKYFQNYGRIAQLAIRGEDKDGRWTGLTLTYPMTTVLTEHHSMHFKNIVRTSWESDPTLSFDERDISVTGLYADPKAPEMFTFKMIHGTRSGLNETQSIMLGASVSKALFGNEDPTGKIVRVNYTEQATVTGVFEDFPLNTRFSHIKWFRPFSRFLQNNPWIEKDAANDWRNHFVRAFVEIVPDETFESINERIKNIVQIAPEDRDKGTREAMLFPMSRWHLFPYDNHRGGIVDEQPVQMILLVGTIGVFVLLLACVNFMNLSTARSERRAKEVGIRKTIGSVQRQLIYQFFTESYLIVISSFALAILLVVITLPWFNHLAAKDMIMPWPSILFWSCCLMFLFITGLLAGSYPAFYLSSFQPVKVLKGTFRAGRLASVPRKVLVVMQFTVCVALIICTVVVYQQIQFAKNRPVGYTRQGLIMTQIKTEEFNKNLDVLRTELKNTGVVEELSATMGSVTRLASNNGGFGWTGQEPDQKQNFGTLAVTAEHGRTIGWHFIQGRDFSIDHPEDSSSLVINESAARVMGFDDPIGEAVSWEWWHGDRPPLHYKIIGVIKDIVMDSPFDPVKPTFFYLKGHNGDVKWGSVTIRIKSGIIPSEALTRIESTFKKVLPSTPFEYKFVDEEYALKFAAEERIGKLATFFGSLAIFISCLGLFGLSSFVAEQRTKEIGIRKVLGASVTNLWQMLSKDFVLLVVLSSVIASPIAYYFLNEWLQQYTYRIEISSWVFIATAIGSLIMTLATVSFQAVRAALMNPVKSLRSE